MSDGILVVGNDEGPSSECKLLKRRGGSRRKPCLVHRGAPHDSKTKLERDGTGCTGCARLSADSFPTNTAKKERDGVVILVEKDHCRF